jgi:hypothetical protein
MAKISPKRSDIYWINPELPYISRAYWWIPTSIAGVTLGYPVGMGLLNLSDSRALIRGIIGFIPNSDVRYAIEYALGFALIGVLFGIFLGVAQSFILRRSISNNNSWVWISALGLGTDFGAGHLFNIVIRILFRVYTVRGHMVTDSVTHVIIGSIYGLVTGFWLSRIDLGRHA